MPLVGKWIQLETTILSKISQTRRSKCCIFVSLWVLRILYRIFMDSLHVHKIISIHDAVKTDRGLEKETSGGNTEQVGWVGVKAQDTLTGSCLVQPSTVDSA